MESSPRRSSLDTFSISIVFLVTLVLVSGMVVDRQSVTLAVICGTGFFSLFGGFVILTLSGQLVRLAASHQRERTIRLHDQMQYSLYLQPAQVELVKPTMIEGGERGETIAPHFVPAIPSVEEGVKISAYDFVYNLYNNGSLDPTRVLPEESRSPGQIQFKKPRNEVVEYLLALGMVRVGENKMLFYNTVDFPTLVHAKRAIKHGIRKE